MSCGSSGRICVDRFCVLEGAPSFLPSILSAAWSWISLPRYMFKRNGICISTSSMFCSYFREDEALLCSTSCPPVDSQPRKHLSLQGLFAKVLETSTGVGAGGLPAVLIERHRLSKARSHYWKSKRLQHLNKGCVILLVFPQHYDDEPLVNVSKVCITVKVVINSGSEELFLKGHKLNNEAFSLSSVLIRDFYITAEPPPPLSSKL